MCKEQGNLAWLPEPRFAFVACHARRPALGQNAPQEAVRTKNPVYPFYNRTANKFPSSRKYMKHLRRKYMIFLRRNPLPSLHQRGCVRMRLFGIASAAPIPKPSLHQRRRVRLRRFGPAPAAPTPNPHSTSTGVPTCTMSHSRSMARSVTAMHPSVQFTLAPVPFP